jgi:Tol biopolymer transport system component
MSLPPGTRIGPYDVVGPLGAGGMGEVYRATDTNLKRQVALKVLPAALAADTERLARFQREAEVLAALNHPHIAAIYGLEKSGEVTALVMELVEGEDLAQRLTRGAVPLDDALPIARQIAEALEAAHEQGIIHRDLKPANIKVRPDGTVKVLDFGLAKALDPADSHSAGNQANSPTITSPAMTMRGVILGTAAYMSPEQAKGKPVDRRADIWAFGAVLFEMLTGSRAFDGEDVTETIISVITKDPDWSRLPPSTPPAVMTLLRRCLEKHAPKRLPHIGVARLELEAPGPVPGAAATPPAAAPLKGSRIGVLGWAGMTVALAAGIAGGTWWASRTAPAVPASIYRSTLLIPSEQSLIGNAPSNRFALSPDAAHLAYVGMNGQTRQLWLRALDGTTAQIITGTLGASSPFWSPDSRYVGFFAEGKLLKVDRAGGSAETIGQSPFFAENVQGSWGTGNVIIVGARNIRGEGLQRISAMGGTLEPLTSPDPSRGEDRHSFVHFLPDGRHFLYVAYQGIAPIATYVATLDRPGERVRLMEGGSNLQVAQDALIFMRGNALVMQPFDPATRTLSGETVTIADPVLTNTAVPFGGAFSVSAAGALAYQSATLESGIGSRGHKLVWRTRSGAEQVVIDDPSDYRNLSVDSEGRRAVVSQIGDQAGRANLWIVDLARSVRRRFTFGTADRAGVWLPDGKGVIFTAAKEGRIDLYRKSTDGTGTESEVLSDERPKASLGVSRDGRFLLFETGDDIWSLPLDGAAKPAPFVATEFEERYAQFSPDGHWVAYTSNESGRLEIYVRAFPGGAGLVQVSPNGGDLPRWSADGTELFFYNDGKMVAASVGTSGGRFDITSVTPLFDCRRPDGFRRMFYDVAPDGRFLMMAPDSAPGPTPLTLVVNWRELLTRTR